MKKSNRFPPGWDEQRVRAVLEHYEAQTEEEAVAEDEAAYKSERSIYHPACPRMNRRKRLHVRLRNGSPQLPQAILIFLLWSWTLLLDQFVAILI
jgi:hypothetical protein